MSSKSPQSKKPQSPQPQSPQSKKPQSPQPKSPQSKKPEQDIKSYTLNIDEYFDENIYIYPNINVKKLLQANEDVSSISFDLLYELFLKIYTNINVIENNIQLKEFDKIILYDGTGTTKIAFSALFNRIQLSITNEIEQTKREQLLYTQLESKLDSKKIYQISHSKALDIVIFNKSILKDINFGKNKFFKENNENFCELFDIKDKSLYQTYFEDFKNIQYLQTDQNGVFKRLHKYYYYLMYLFQLKIQKNINEYYQIKFFELFKKLNDKITIEIVKILDNKIFNNYNEKTFDVSKIFKIKSSIEKIINPLSFNYIVNKINSNEIKDRNEYSDFITDKINQLHDIYVNNFRLNDEMSDIFKDLIIFYNPLIYLLETNIVSTDGKYNTKYNRFLKVFNNFDKLEDISVGTSGVVSGGGGNINNFISQSKTILTQNREDVVGELVKRDKISNNKYGNFITYTDISKCILIASSLYFNEKKPKLIPSNEKKSNMFNDIISSNEKIYKNMNKEFVSSLKDEKDKFFNIELCKGLVYKIPKYVKFSDTFYETYEKDISLDILLDNEMNNNVSIFDFLLYRYKNHILNLLTYYVKFLIDYINLLNEEIKRDIINEKIIPNKDHFIIHIPESIIEVSSGSEEDKNKFKIYFRIFYIDLVGMIKYLIIGDIDKISTCIDRSAYLFTYNYIVYVFLNEPYIKTKLSKFYNDNYNFSKLITEFITLKKSYFNIENTFIDIKFNNQISTDIDIFDDLYTYLEFINKPIEIKSKTEYTTNYKRTKTLSPTNDISINDIINIYELERITNQKSNNIPSSSSKQNTKTPIIMSIAYTSLKNNMYNYFLYKIKNILQIIKKDKIISPNDLIERYFTTKNYIEIYKFIVENKQDIFIANIIFPLYFDIFIYTYIQSISTKSKEFNTILNDFKSNILYSPSTIDKYIIIDTNNIESKYINLLLFILYSKISLQSYYKKESFKIKILYNKTNFDNFYKSIFGDIINIEKLNVPIQIELISLDTFKERYYKPTTTTPPAKSPSTPPSKKNSTPSSTPTAKKPATQSSTPTAKKPATQSSTPPAKSPAKKNSTQSATPPAKKNATQSATNTNQRTNKIITLNTPTTILLQKPKEDNTNTYIKLLDENYYFNRNNREILKRWRILNGFDYDPVLQINKYTPKNKELYSKNKSIIKRMLIYRNEFIIDRIKKGFNNIYTFLNSTDIHYTIIKYSIKEKEKYKTCGAYTHLTLEICKDENKYGIYDMLLNQIGLNQDNDLIYITLHYGLSNWKDEIYGLIPNLWIRVNYNVDSAKKPKSYAIDIDLLYRECQYFVELIKNLYNIFIEYIKYNKKINPEYYLNPTCSKDVRQIKYIENTEIFIPKKT